MDHERGHFQTRSGAPLLSLGILALLTLPGVARSDVVFSSLPASCIAQPIGLPGCPVSVGNSVGTEGGMRYVLASAFTASSGGSLTDVVLAIYAFDTVGTAATVTLHADADAGGSIGALLATGTGPPVSRPPAPPGAYLDVLMNSTALRADTRSWLEVEAGTPAHDWLVSSVPCTSTGGGNVTDDYQFSVRVADPTATATSRNPTASR